MGILDRFKSFKTSALAPEHLILPNPWPAVPNVRFGSGLDCVGESFYKESLGSLLGDDPEWTGVAVLLPEPTNPHDSNAIGVYINGLKVGHLSKAQAVAMSKSIYATIRQHGCAAVEASLLGSRETVQVILEPSTISQVSRPRITQALLAAQFKPREGDECGFTMRDEGDRYKVFCSGGSTSDRENLVPAYAKALRDAGYKARVAREDGYPYVSVTS